MSAPVPPGTGGPAARVPPLPFFMPGARRAAAFAFVCAAAVAGLRRAAAEGGPPPRPRIERLAPSDPAFRQLSADVEDARRRLAKAAGPEEIAGALTVYEYLVREGDDIFALAARCGIPYETLATANRVARADDSLSGRSLLIPTTPGLFVPVRPSSDLERLMALGRDGSGAVELDLGGASRFAFYPDSAFTPTERAFFLNSAFRLPLPAGTLTSGFGPRRNPVTGNIVVHRGLDLAAPEGTPVYATRDGVVAAAGFDPVYGNFVEIAHEGGWKSLYGHLEERLADLRKEVRSGTMIGRVGSTGQSTGPHLHFELSRDGEARDPAPLLPRGFRR